MENKSSNYTVPDTLVIKLEEYDIDTNELDNTIYLLYDSRTDTYIIRGKRTDAKTYKLCSYSFECDCDSKYDLIDFLHLVIAHENDMSFTMYMYDNLPENSNDITFNFLKENDDKRYEIVGYDKLKPTKKKFLKYLRILRSVLNYY